VPQTRAFLPWRLSNAGLRAFGAPGELRERAASPKPVTTTALSMRNKLCEQKAWKSLNQRISLCDEERRHFETERFGGLQIDH